MKHQFTILALLILLMGCQVGPKTREPQVEMPEKYSHQGQIKDGGDLRDFWKQFEDPALSQLIQEALEANLDMKIALERVLEARSEFRFSFSELLPEIDAVGEQARFRTSQTLSDSAFLGPTLQYFYRLGFDAAWEIDLFGKLRSLKNAAYYDLLAYREAFRDVLITVISDVARLYLEIRTLQKRIETLNESIAAFRELFNLAESNHMAGLTSGIDMEESLALLEEKRAQLPQLIEEHQLALFSLGTLLGKTPEEMPAELALGDPFPNPVGRVPLGLPSELLQRRPDIRQKLQNLMASGARVQSSIADLFPRFSLTGYYRYDTSQSRLLFQPESRSWKIGPSMFWPILDFGRINAQIHAAKARKRAALIDYKQAILVALEDVEGSLISYAQESERLYDLTKEREARQTRRDLISSQYQAGLIAFSEVLDSEKDLLEAEERFWISRGREMINLIALYKALGGGW